MDALQNLLEQFNTLVGEHLVTLAGETGTLEIKQSDLGLVFVSTAMGLAARLGASKDHLQHVTSECLSMIEDDEPKSKIILS